MKLPLLQKVEINTIEEELLRGIIKKNSLNLIPTILLFDQLDNIPVEKAIKACQKTYEEMELNPILPYPTYIIHQPGLSQNYFPELKSITDAPKHFIKKIKRVKKREQALHAKATTLSERINNHNLNEDLNYIKTKAADNKKLKVLCSEKQFYLDLLEKIKNPPSRAGKEAEE